MVNDMNLDDKMQGDSKQTEGKIPKKTDTGYYQNPQDSDNRLDTSSDMGLESDIQ